MSCIRGRKALGRNSESCVQSVRNGRKKQKTIKLDDQIESDDEEESIANYSEDDVNDRIEEEETLDSKKVRLAREYLRTIESGDGSDDDSDTDNDNDHDRIGDKLQRERLKQTELYERAVADKVHDSLKRIRTSFDLQRKDVSEENMIESGYIRLLRGHDLTPTCVSLQQDGSFAISGSKDHSVIIWDVENERRALDLCKPWKKESLQEKQTTSRTNGEILSVALSYDGRFAAVGRRNATVCIYDVRTNSSKLVKTFVGHKGAVTSLSFQTQSLQLFSGSQDRCIRYYNINEMIYLETLYGHQFGVTAVDCHLKERPVSVGRDRTARVWKISDDAHLIFRGGAKFASADSVRLMKEDWFLSGHEDGTLGLWMVEKKRAVMSIDYAHGCSAANVGRGISAIGSDRSSPDLAITGSHDGYLRLWKISMGQTLQDRGIEPIDAIPLKGHVNGIAVGPKAQFCVIAVGQEPRLGRWSRISGAKNRLGIVRLGFGETFENDHDHDDKEV